MDRIYTTGDVLRIFDIPQYQLYYWEETKKIPEARRTESGKRYYLADDIVELKRIIPELQQKSTNTEHTTEEKE